MNIPDERIISEYYELRKQLTEDMQAVISQPNYCLPFMMQPGRLVQIKYMGYNFGWGAVVNFKQRRPPINSSEKLAPHQSYVVDVLLKIATGSLVGAKTHKDLPSDVRPPKDSENSRIEIVPVVLSRIQAISHIRIFLPRELQTIDSRNTIGKALEEVQNASLMVSLCLTPLEICALKMTYSRNY